MLRTSVSFISPAHATVTIERSDDAGQLTDEDMMSWITKMDTYIANLDDGDDEQVLMPPISPTEPGPTFCGYPCTHSLDEDSNMPTGIFVNGRYAKRRDRQGDIWYSMQVDDGSWVKVLKIPKGETAPAIKWP